MTGTRALLSDGRLCRQNESGSGHHVRVVYEQNGRQKSHIESQADYIVVRFCIQNENRRDEEPAYTKIKRVIKNAAFAALFLFYYTYNPAFSCSSLRVVTGATSCLGSVAIKVPNLN